MIESLKLVNAPSFAPNAELGGLQRCTFIFGSNGSGKTTISRALVDPSLFLGTVVTHAIDSDPITVKVYNRDYVNQTYQAANSLKGVFRLLDKKESDVRDQINALEGPAGSIPAKVREVEGLKSTLGVDGFGDNTAMIPRRDAARTTLQEAAWMAKGQLAASLDRIFVGYNNSKEKFLVKVLEVAASQQSSAHDLAELQERAEGVFVDDAVALPEANELTIPNFTEQPGFQELGVAILGREEVSVAELIEMLGNADWVREGLQYLSHSQGRCPFCQQEVNHDLATELGEFFDAEYTRRLDSVIEFTKWYEAAATALRDQLAALASEAAELRLDESTFSTARLKLEATLSTNSGLLEQKQEHPGESVILESIESHITRINALISEANLKVREHNALLRNKAAAREQLTLDCWAYFVRIVIGTHVAVFEAATEGLATGIPTVEQKLLTAQRALDDLRIQLRALKNSVSSTAGTVTAINDLLRSVGFSSFHLAQSPDVVDGYAVVRADGNAVQETLSEGERTFITFLYFFQQLKGLAEDGEPDGIAAVIDDPISSLDSDVLFVVSSLVRGLLRDAQDGAGRIRQIILLTHNAYFHRQVAYTRRGDSTAGRAFFTLRKRPSAVTEITMYGDQNPIKTTYIALWDEVGRAHAGDGSEVSLQNVMRRILENYFRIVGRWDVEIVDKFEGDDRVVAQSLISWLHDGSHSILEELDYSPTGVTIQRYLEVFERIFTETGHEAHYKMMLRAPDETIEATLSEDSV